MNLETMPEYIFLGAAGAASLELLKLYELRGKLHMKTYQQQIKSPLFWAVFTGMLLASGFIAWAVNVDRQVVQTWHVVITGIAARSVIRSAVAAKIANTSTKLGPKGGLSETLRKTFL